MTIIAEDSPEYLSDLSTLNNWHVIEDALKHDL